MIKRLVVCLSKECTPQRWCYFWGAAILTLIVAMSFFIGYTAF